MSDKMQQLKTLLAEVTAIEQAIGLLSWDREAKMPPGGAEARGNQLGVLSKIYHERFTSDEIGRLLEDLALETADLNPDSDDARLIKVTRREFDRECKLPAALVEEAARASTEGISVWRTARENSDFKQFAPYLKRNAEISRKLAAAYGYKDRPYDAFIDILEPGITTTQLDTIFAELKATIVPLVQEINERQSAVDDSMLFQHYDPQEQIRVSQEISKRYGYDLNRGRMDLSAHPFCFSFGRDDVRITTRTLPNFLNACLFAVLHETGHALYEQGVSANLAGTPLSGGTSAGVHESQSRLWENLVGRSRAFQEYLFPRLQEAFPQQLGNVDIEAFYKAINKVYASPIRVEADEVTYNLHILMRYELENEMLEDRVDIDSLDEVWNERLRGYLGIEPTTTSQGVLQDIHWAWGGVYNFPSYTLGNVIGTQFFAQAHKEMPNLNDQISRGEFADLLSWLQTNIYMHGRKYEANELMQRVTGKPLDTDAWISYVKGKFPAIYGFQA